MNTEIIYYTVQDLSEIGHVETHLIIEMVEYGILSPQGKKSAQWQFTAEQLQQFKQALRLQRDLELNLPGVALTLDLMHELRESRAQMQRMEQLLKLFTHSHSL